MFISGNYMALSDCLIIACCLGITVLAFNTARVRADSATRVVAIAMTGVVIGVLNFLLDAHWVVPQVRTISAFFAIIYLAGGSKGLLLGLLLGLVLFKQLRLPNRVEIAESDAS
jgi:hypothetical protein